MKNCESCQKQFPDSKKFKRNQCQPCYRKEVKRRARATGYLCDNCQKHPVLIEFGECQSCAQKRRYVQKKECLDLNDLSKRGKWIECPECGRARKHNDLGAKRCARCEYRKRTDGKVCRRRDGSMPYVVNGYVRIRETNHPNRTKDGWIFVHTLVMSQILGRALVKGEAVHHKNGIRNDNSPENLELWTKHHPSGVRVQDLLNWAKNYLKKEKENEQ